MKFLKKRSLFKDLNNLCEEMSHFYNINCGGCCFVAAVIAEQLEKYNIPYQVAISFYPSHYAIKTKSCYINRDYFDFFDEFDDYDSEDLYNIYYNEGHNWNDRYSKRWNLIVKTRINSLFRKYGNNI